MGALFYKLIVNPSTQKYKLRIPGDYVKKYGKQQLSKDKINLKSGDGKVWRVTVSKEGEKVWLTQGLEAFLEHYNVDYGYFLLFKYDHTLKEFMVSIFDHSSCEIDYGDQIQAIQISSSSEDDADTDLHHQEEDDCEEDDSESAESPEARNAEFEVVMKKPNVSNRYRLYLPFKEVKKKLDTTKRRQKLVLIAPPDGKRYQVILTIRTAKCQAEILAGWKKFVKDYNLSVGNLCLFHRVMPSCSDNNNVFKVTIIP